MWNQPVGGCSKSHWSQRFSSLLLHWQQLGQTAWYKQKGYFWVALQWRRSKPSKGKCQSLAVVRWTFLTVQVGYLITLHLTSLRIWSIPVPVKVSLWSAPVLHWLWTRQSSYAWFAPFCNNMKPTWQAKLHSLLVLSMCMSVQFFAAVRGLN